MQTSTSTARADYVSPAAVRPFLLNLAPDSERHAQNDSIGEGVLASLILAIVVLMIHGYHPYAEDGGLYFSAVLKALHPALFPSPSEFVSVLAQNSLFPLLVSALVRASRLRLSTMNFLLYLLSTWTTLFACWIIAARCHKVRTARYGAVLLVALLFTLPVAGTSLLLMDPYVTARSISTPCGLFALAAMLKLTQEHYEGRPLAWRSAAMCCLCIIIAGAVHPLMAGYTGACMVLLFVHSRSTGARSFLFAGLCCLLAVLLAAFLFHLGSPATPHSLDAARTRTYWFIENWHWYEVSGLVIPLLVLLVLASTKSSRTQQAARWLACAAIEAGLTGILISLLFVREDSPFYEVARLQPLRIFQVVYIITILALGSYACARLLAVHRWLPAAVFLVVGAGMFYAQSRVFPHSNHIEWPWCAPRNGWERTFLWARQNTPPDARFALDAGYITYPGEDAQYFGAISERSALPDYSKDGGLAALAPQFADDWVAAQAAQTGLNEETDAQRRSALRPLRVTWIILPASAQTNLACPFGDAAAKVCRL